MDASSVVSSIAASLELHKPPPPPSAPSTTAVMVHTKPKWADGRRPVYDVCQRSEVSTGTDFSNERPSTRDTNTMFMRDASILSSQPDKSNFREKMQNWATYDEEPSTGYVAPRPTTSFASQKPGCRGTIMEDIEREMSFLMSRPSTSFPSKPKELIEPLDGLLPDERPVSQKKFLVLPSIGNNQHGPDMGFLRRQRSNIETTNQLDYSRGRLEREANFFTDYHNYYQHQHNHNHSPSSYHHHYYYHDDQDPDAQHTHHHHGHRDATTTQPYSSPQGRNPRESPTKGKTSTPMPLPPIVHKLKWEKRARPSANRHLAGLVEEYSRDHSRLSSNSSAIDDDNDEEEEEEEDPEMFRIKTPDSLSLSSSPTRKYLSIPPPVDFR